MAFSTSKANLKLFSLAAASNKMVSEQSVERFTVNANYLLTLIKILCFGYCYCDRFCKWIL